MYIVSARTDQVSKLLEGQFVIHCGIKEPNIESIQYLSSYMKMRKQSTKTKMELKITHPRQNHIVVIFHRELIVKKVIYALVILIANLPSDGVYCSDVF